MNSLKHLFIAAVMVAVPLSSLGTHVYAQGTNTIPGEITNNLDLVRDESNLGDKPLEETIGMLINVLLGVLGIIFLILVIYAGFLWMTAGGDPKRVESAKNILITSVIGLVILLSAYAISNFVIQQLIDATGSGG